MRLHPITAVLAVHNLTLRESVKPIWSGGITALVRYSVLSSHGDVVAEEDFHYNRNPGFYRRQGGRARNNTARHVALDRLLIAAQRHAAIGRD
jgi:hypothetical protein